jgi:hypothetical protein
MIDRGHVARCRLTCRCDRQARALRQSSRFPSIQLRMHTAAELHTVPTARSRAWVSGRHHLSPGANHMRKLIRDAASIATGLVAAVFCARAIGFAALFAIAHGLEVASTVIVARAANLILVPIAAGAVMGAFRPRRPAVLAVLLVAVSLALTYRSLGPAGLPHGWKIVAYFAQTAIVALAATWTSHRNASSGGPSGITRHAADFTNAEADERSDEMEIALAPVFLGGGRRLFENLRERGSSASTRFSMLRAGVWR